MKNGLQIEDLEVGQELKEKQKWLNQRQQFCREKGHFKAKGQYELCKDVKHIVTNKTTSSVEVLCGKKTNKGVNAKQWFDIRNINDRFEK